MIKILGKLYEGNPIQVSEQQASKDSNPWEMGNKGGETCNYPLLLPEESSPVRTLEGDPRQSPVELFSLGDSAVNLGMTGRLELIGQSIGEKEEATKDNCRQLQSPSSTQIKVRACRWETILSWGYTAENTRGKSTRISFPHRRKLIKDENLDLHKSKKTIRNS